MRGRRAHWDHLHSRGHHARQRGGDRARALVTLVHLDLVLRLIKRGRSCNDARVGRASNLKSLSGQGLREGPGEE